MLIPDSKRKELNILFTIIHEETQSLQYLAQLQAVSKRTVKEDLAKLNETADQLLGIDSLITANHRGDITINKKHKKQALLYFYQIKLHYFEDSPKFRLLLQLIIQYQVSKDDLLDKLFISDSYLYKLVRQLNTDLKPYAIFVANDRDGYRLAGDEISLRLFAYVILTDTYQGMKWPFPQLSLAELERRIPNDLLTHAHTRSNNKKHYLFLLYMIIEVRFEGQRYLMPPETPDLSTFMEQFETNLDVGYLFYENFLPKIPEIALKTEITFFNFLGRIFVADLIPASAQLTMGQKLMRSENPLSQQITQGLIRLQKELPLHLSREQQASYTYYLAIFYGMFLILGERTGTYAQLMIPQPNFYLETETKRQQQITAVLTDCFKTSQPDRAPALAQFLASLLASLLRSNRTSALKIYVHVAKDFTASYVIKERLAALFNPKQIVVTTDYEQAHLIVTDNLERAESGKRIFYLDSINNETAWRKLCSLIKDLCLEQLQQSN
ncbi:helix-turn-helix domain-containing protein [Enterococcus sp. CSURQ0835]|uniref:helix-turn-helix domain-containing protein n=1 Tax=Enterococcus sp. CSURQ0835 TaxID=2681394 RepID=UPI00135C7603|nr:helix-turn-helix domain-containing protein [Enterococcus sp. CSURQ0835]